MFFLLFRRGNNLRKNSIVETIFSNKSLVPWSCSWPFVFPTNQPNSDLWHFLIGLFAIFYTFLKHSCQEHSKYNERNVSWTKFPRNVCQKNNFNPQISIRTLHKSGPCSIFAEFVCNIFPSYILNAFLFFLKIHNIKNVTWSQCIYSIYTAH